MRLRTFNIRRSARLMLLGLTGAAGIATIMATSVATGPFRSTGEGFLLAFKDAESNRLQIMQSPGGIEWLIFLGWEPPAGDAPVSGAIILTEPFYTIAPLNDESWLDSFTTLNHRASLFVVNRTDAAFHGIGSAPDHSLNSNVAGEPAVAALGDRIVLAWRRGNGPRYELVTAAGVVRDSQIEFDEPVVFKRGALRAAGEAFNSGVPFKDGVVAGPALSHGAGGEFIMLVVRETWDDVHVQEEGRTIPPRYRAAVYSSTDGADWNMHSAIDPSELPVGPGSHIGIAGFTDSTAIAIAVNGEPGRPGRASVARYCLGPLWWERDAKTVFGDVPAAGPFVLLSIGEPALPGPGEYYDCVEN